MVEIKKCATCGCSCGVEEDVVEAPAVPATPEESVVAGEEIKSFRLHKRSNDTEFAVLLALVPAMTMTLFNLMGLL